VIGTTSTPEKAELAKAHGADHVILYKDEDIVQRVKEITQGEGVDAIFDGVGKDTYALGCFMGVTRMSEWSSRFELDFEVIKRKGTLVSVGNASGAVPPFAPLKLTPKNVKLLRPTYVPISSPLGHLVRLFILPSMGNYVVTPEELTFYGTSLFTSIADGSIKVNVFKEYPFTADGVRQSQIDLTGGKTTGKLLITIRDE
jgi:NADPH:quinone reductase